MDYELLFPGRFLKSVEFKGQDVTLTIASLRLEELEGDSGKKMKAIVSFRETKKEWVMNRTNAECIKAMFGRETNAWIGKRVTLFPDAYTDPFTKKLGTAIRVKGSPEIRDSVNASFKLGRKGVVTMTLVRTGPAKAGKGAKATPPPAEASEQEPPPPFDDSDMPPEAA